MKLAPHRVFGIFGRNGAGKTTIFNLLTQLYLPSAGTISLDGISINDVQYRFFQENIGYIRQNPILFNMTLIDNLLLFKDSDDISLEKIQETCEAVNLWEDIQNMPQGLETEINDYRKLSVGQTQKLQIARVLLMDRPIILIDEATVNLDQSSKLKVYEIIKELALTKTVVFITNNENEFELCNENFLIN